MELDYYPVELILSRKAERGFFGMGSWKTVYSSDYTTKCGFDVADLDPVKLLKTLLMTCHNPSTWQLVDHNTEILFKATKGNRKTLYSNDGDFGITKYIVMLDLFPLNLMKPSMNMFFRYLLGGDRDGDYNTMSNIWKPGKIRPLKQMISVREELSFHVSIALQRTQRILEEQQMTNFCEEFLNTYFNSTPKLISGTKCLDEMVECMRDGKRVIHKDHFNEVYSVLFDHPRIIHGVRIPCSGCFIEIHIGKTMKCKLHDRRVVYQVAQVNPQPSAPPAELLAEYLAPPK